MVYIRWVLREPIPVHCTVQAGHGRGCLLKQDDGCESFWPHTHELFFYGLFPCLNSWRRIKSKYIITENLLYNLIFLNHFWPAKWNILRKNLLIFRYNSAEPAKSLPNLLDYDNLDLLASNLDPWAHLHDQQEKVTLSYSVYSNSIEGKKTHREKQITSELFGSFHGFYSWVLFMGSF